MEPLTLGLIIDDKEMRNELGALISEMPVRVIMDQPAITDWNVYLEKLEKIDPDVVLIDVAHMRDPLEEALQKIRSLPSAPMVVVLHRSADPQLILTALRAGAHEFLSLPLEIGLVQALERLSQECARQRRRNPAGNTVAFLSAKGGCGSTTIACHVAIELARQTKQHALLADLDLDGGAIGFLMKSKSAYSVLDAAKNVNRLDLSFWKALVSNGHPGLEVISAPSTLSLRETPSPEQIRGVLRFTRSHYEWTIIDLGSALNELSTHALDEIDKVFVVSTVELLALHQAQQVGRRLINFGYAKDRVHLVLNRVTRRSPLSTTEVEELVGLPLYSGLPNAYSDLSTAYTERRLVTANSEFGRSMSSLAGKVAGIEPDKSQRKFRFFN